MEKDIKIIVPEEIWKDIPNYENLYQVSSLGRVRSLNRKVNTSIKHNSFAIRKGKILKQIPHHHGYLFVSLSKNNNTKLFSVHRLVANAFIPNKKNKPFIDHINTKTGDNRVENLRWVTASENSQNPITFKRRVISNIGSKNPMFGKHLTEDTKIKLSRPVLQFSKSGTFFKRISGNFFSCKRSKCK